MAEHIVSFYHLNDITEAELRKHLPELPDLRITEIGDTEDPQDYLNELSTATIVLAPLEKERRIGTELLDAMPRCRLIQSVAVGFDGVDHVAAAERGIPVANLPGFNADAVADWTVGAMLYLLRHYAAGHRKVNDGGWGPEGLRGRDLSAMRVGILGFGNIGRAVARRIDGFGARVVVHDPAPSEPGREYLSLRETVATSDILTLHLPLNPTTRGLLDEELLATLPRGGYVVNAGRGGVIDEAALARALDSGQVAGAALDVFTEEPLPEVSPLRGRSDVLLNPHAAGVTREAYHKLREQLFATLTDVVNGQEPLNVVNRTAAAG
ncbi:2-hydroxyacid dehydrogenase [Prauserella rugosa]|uniref:D-3-phosphoglycerate dehydrogenase n=1 Tax=Prauserella rugosa TaxID=43354 RepID=A0A660CEI1_9PSEU|nr:2-hydroxyacid dehydrogenase [Prauserella rugosa]KMS72016.1 2-hydroxyacid dehydrogenase [Streptomyces regensis]TWH21812.1 D-3-phosphoglycerate dehydrogenase [Prauserella rugosa]